jgi:hypothetical protein
LPGPRTGSHGGIEDLQGLAAILIDAILFAAPSSTKN